MSPRKKKSAIPVQPVHDPEVAISVERPPEPPKVMERIAAKTGTKFYRMVETIGFVYALVNLGALMTVEVFHRAGYRFGNTEPDHGFPYGVLIGSVILLVPKLIGRAFAGKALVAIASRGGDTGETVLPPSRGTADLDE